jgi:hypothetical protein
VSVWRGPLAWQSLTCSDSFGTAVVPSLARYSAVEAFAIAAAKGGVSNEPVDTSAEMFALAEEQHANIIAGLVRRRAASR